MARHDTKQTFEAIPAESSVVHRIHLEAGISYNWIRGDVTTGRNADPRVQVLDSITGIASYNRSAVLSGSWQQSTGGAFDVRIDTTSTQVKYGYGYRLTLDRSDFVRGDTHTKAKIFDGGRVEGRLDNKSDADMYALKVEEGRTYSFVLDTDLDDPIGQTQWGIRDSSGSWIRMNDKYDPSEFSYEADADQKIFLSVEVPSGYPVDPIGDFRLSVTSDAENITGTRKGDELYGSEIDNYIQGYNGRDTIHAGGGDDRVVGGRGKDVLHGGEGEDTLVHVGRHGVVVNMDKGVSRTKGLGDRDRFDGFENVEGTRGKDKLIGSAEDNMLSGGRGRDVIKGQGGNDVIDGGRGKDKLTGGLGGDEFVFDARFGKDVIKDFNVDVDHITFRHHAEGKIELTDRRGDTVIDFGGRDSVKILDVSSDDLEDALFFG
ncbi:calcium-binding protein [Limimaricola cinnabarinus]|jgi:Ca2+-binding RTX toxin-like protein|uniref:calcium-binding protein n=1 Tax=Limimaricola cinnabarinus TaxID=1125964 RepID=UPI000D7CC4CF|nr:calcium-binding protein [Limimaricola cinnabarinus]